jgi:hypothetical protein
VSPNLHSYLSSDNVFTDDSGKDHVTIVGKDIKSITSDLFGRLNNWPKRVDSLLFFEAADHKPLFVEDPAALFAAVGDRLPSCGGANPIRWRTGSDLETKAQLFAALQQKAENYLAVEPLPHEPQIPGHFYLHPPVQGGSGRALADLIAFFRPATSVDRDLIEALFLSLFWGGAASTRPAWLITSEDDDRSGGRGIGKSTLAKMAAKLAGGAVVVRPEEDISRVTTRLLSPDAMERRVVLIDNLKTLRFSCADLEGLITMDRVSGHRLYTGNASRPNTLNWLFTLNGANLSQDLAQRCVVVQLARPTHTAGWEEAVAAYIDAHLMEIVGDCLARLRGSGHTLAHYSRWGAWERDVLAKIADPVAAQKVIKARQDAIDDDSADADLVRQAFRESLELRDPPHDPDKDRVFIPSRVAAEIVNAALKEKRPVNKACAYLNTLAIPELRKSARNGQRGFMWTGLHATPEQQTLPIRGIDPLRTPEWMDGFFPIRMNGQTGG